VTTRADEDRKRTRRRRLLWYLIPLSLLVFDWVMTSPPLAGPDEGAQYIKALGTVSADPIGHPAVWMEPEAPIPPGAFETYLESTSRSYPLDKALPPRIPILPCFIHQSTVNASCGNQPPTGKVQDVSYVGTYPPLYYLLPGLAAHLANSAVGGLRAARVAGSLEFLAVVALALALLDRDGTGPPIYGVLLVLTPTTTSLGGTLTDSGFEIVSAMLFMCACVRLAESGRPSTRLLAVTVLAGTLLAWSRPIGPAWVAEALLLATCWAGGRRMVELARARSVRVAALVLVTLTAASGAWDLALGFGSGTGRISVPLAIHLLRGSAVTLGKEQIGVFGYAEVFLPRPAYVIGALLIGSALVSAGVFGRWRERVSIVVGAALFLVTSVALEVTLVGSGTGLRGRYILPIWALLAVVVGETLRRAQQRRKTTQLAKMAGTTWFLVFAGLNVGAVYFNARRYAVGAGHSTLFFLHPKWSPIGGWLPWLIVLAIAGVGFVFAAANDFRSASVQPEYTTWLP
jgi:Predicted membrane protein (DUF2142)